MRKAADTWSEDMLKAEMTAVRILIREILLLFVCAAGLGLIIVPGISGVWKYAGSCVCLCLAVRYSAVILYHSVWERRNGKYGNLHSHKS